MEMATEEKLKQAAGAGHGEAAKGEPARKAEAVHEEATIPADLPRPRGWMVALMALAVVVLLGGLFAVGWAPHHKAQEQAKSDAEEIAGQVPLVTVTSPAAGPRTTDLVLPCDVKANQETAIYPRTNGYLKAQYVDIQDHVTKGQLLAEIDTPEVDAQLVQAKAALSQAKAALQKAESDLTLAHSTLERYQVLQHNGVGTVTKQEMEEKQNVEAQQQSAVKQAGANVEAADAAVQRLTVLQGFEKVVAPFSGTITARNYDVGALLSASETAPGKEMFRIAETETLRVFVNVPQVYSGQVKIGGPAYLTANGQDFAGTVARSSDSVDPSTRTILFELRLPNKEGKLYAGMYGMAKLELTQERPTLLIPTNALRFDAGGVRVVVVKDGKVHFQDVRPGRDLGTQLEIVEGLEADSEVVTNPSESMREGQAVKVMGAGTPKKEAVAAGKTPAKGRASAE
jgi:RND family efflux transporter MFP subunit